MFEVLYTGEKQQRNYMSCLFLFREMGEERCLFFFVGEYQPTMVEHPLLMEEMLYLAPHEVQSISKDSGTSAGAGFIPPTVGLGFGIIGSIQDVSAAV